MYKGGFPRPVKDKGFDNSIKSIQTGSYSLSAMTSGEGIDISIPIENVDHTKCLVLYNISYNSTSANFDFNVGAYVLDATTLRVERKASSTIPVGTLNYTVIEFTKASVQSVSYSISLMGTGTTANITISAVDPLKSLVFCQDPHGSSTPAVPGYFKDKIIPTLTTATNLRLTRAGTTQVWLTILVHIVDFS